MSCVCVCVSVSVSVSVWLRGDVGFRIINSHVSHRPFDCDLVVDIYEIQMLANTISPAGGGNAVIPTPMRMYAVSRLRSLRRGMQDRLEYVYFL